jgi:hypothetical protein
VIRWAWCCLVRERIDGGKNGVVSPCRVAVLPANLWRKPLARICVEHDHIGTQGSD